MLTCLPGRSPSLDLLEDAVAMRQSPFGEWLVRERERLGFSQADIASRAGYSQELISGIERGTRAATKKNIPAISKALVPDNIDGEEQETRYQALLAEAKRLAFGVENGNPYYTIIHKAGYDDQDFTGEEMDQIERSFQTIVDGIVARKRREQGRDPETGL